MSKKVIDNGAFSRQTTITSVNFGSDCASIGESAFEYCVSLSEINDNNIIESIGSKAFAKTNISSATFNSLNTIHSNAFQSCSNLSYISIPNCSIIGEGAFSECINLNTIKSGEIKTTVSSYAFYGCSNLNNITFEYFDSIGSSAFQNCTNLEKANLIQCKKIGSYAFNGCSEINQIALSICSHIGLYAFANCPNLEKVYVNTPKDIFCHLDGSHVFCTHSGSSYSINSNIVFYFNANIFNLYAEDIYWKHYSNYMLNIVENNQIVYKSTDNKLIEVKNEIEDLLIENNESVKGNEYLNGISGVINFKEKVKNLGSIFTNPEKLLSIDIPSECEHIDANAFDGCTQLKTITLSNTLKTIGDSAFKNCELLTSFVIPNTVTEIGEGAFSGCKRIKKFEGKEKFIRHNGNILLNDYKLLCVLPNDNSDTEGRIYKISDIDENIKIICKSCFQGCEKLRRVNIPYGITEIHDDAFIGCTNLRELHFEGDIPPTLGNNAFGDVRDDFKIFVPEEYFETYHKAWENTSYTNYIYPMAAANSVIWYSSTEIALSLTKPEHVTHTNLANGDYYKISNVVGIPASYFASKDTISKVMLGDGITTLGENSFSGCTRLEYIYLSDSISSLGSQCFSNCTGLKNIHIPKYEKSVFGDSIFYGCTNLKEFGTYYKGYVSDDNMCYIDNGSLMFFAQGGLPENDKSYIIPNNITEINRSAFRGSNITNITLNPSVKTIGNTAFKECKQLLSISNWEGVESISNGAFQECKNLAKISLPDNLKAIGDGAFRNCTNMYINKNIPESVTSIGEYAFYFCTSFKCDVNGKEEQLDLKNITEINQYTFYNCDSLSTVKLNKKTTTIGGYAFGSCSNLIEVDIDKDSALTKINNSAFSYCIKLSTFNIPEKLINIGSSVFLNCYAYTNKITLPDTVTTMGSGCFSGSGITEFELLDYSKLPLIPDSAFNNCRNLKRIKISTSRKLLHIGQYAFRDCINLCNNILDKGRLCLPNSIESIRPHAFFNCKNILNVTLPSNLSTIGDKSFYTNSNIKIHIPLHSVLCPVFSSTLASPFDNSTCKIFIHNSIINNYKTNSYWKKYQNIIYVDNSITLTINLRNAYIDKEYLGTYYKVTNVGVLDTTRSIYLYDSLWGGYRELQYKFKEISQYILSFSVNLSDMDEFLYRHEGIDFYGDKDLESYENGSIPTPRYKTSTTTLNVSIPMKVNNYNFRILVPIANMGVVSVNSIFTPTDVMLSMNTNLENGEDWDNIATFYCPNETDKTGETGVPKYLLMGYSIDNIEKPINQSEIVTAPGRIVHKVCPSIMCAHSFDNENAPFTLSAKLLGSWKQMKYITYGTDKPFSLLGYFRGNTGSANKTIFLNNLAQMISRVGIYIKLTQK